jgi:hypothetical protein
MRIEFRLSYRKFSPLSVGQDWIADVVLQPIFVVDVLKGNAEVLRGELAAQINVTEGVGAPSGELCCIAFRFDLIASALARGQILLPV